MKLHIAAILFAALGWVSAVCHLLATDPLPVSLKLDKPGYVTAVIERVKRIATKCC